MTKTSAASGRITADAAAEFLRVQGSEFHGSFCSQKKKIVFVAEDQIFLESEHAELFGKMN